MRPTRPIRTRRSLSDYIYGDPRGVPRWWYCLHGLMGAASAAAFLAALKPLLRLLVHWNP